MAVPKRKTSKARRDQRRANWKLSIPGIVECPQCHQPKLAHRVCKQCGYATDEDVCPICGSTEFTEKSVREETLTDDIIRGNPADPTKPRLLLAKKGDKVKYYALRRIPLVMRVNISRVDSPYGVSDVDILTETQLSSNNILTKIEQNILKAGSIITMPEKMNMKLSRLSIKWPNFFYRDKSLAYRMGLRFRNSEEDILI